MPYNTNFTTLMIDAKSKWIRSNWMLKVIKNTQNQQHLTTSVAKTDGTKCDSEIQIGLYDS